MTTTTKTRKVRSDKGKPRAKKAAAAAPKRATSGKPTADAPATKSVVPAKYKARYGKLGNSGDPVALKLAEVCGTPADPAKLRKLAEANGCWREEYASLNFGQQRMNVGNRLRGMSSRGETIKWGR